MSTAEVSVAVIGAGGRGTSNARRIRRAGGRITAVAEPQHSRRERFADEHGVDEAHRFVDWQDLAGHPRCADAALVTTQDREHVDPCVRLAESGYHLLCEKPMAPTDPEARRIADAVARSGVLFAVFHSLRYTRRPRRRQRSRRGRPRARPRIPIHPNSGGLSAGYGGVPVNRTGIDGLRIDRRAVV